MVHVDGFQMICLQSCCTSILSGIGTLPSCHWRWWLTPASIPGLFFFGTKVIHTDTVVSILFWVWQPNPKNANNGCPNGSKKNIPQTWRWWVVTTLSIVWPSNENPASDNKSIAFCFSGSGSPYMMSRAAALYPWCFTHLVAQASPAKSSMKSYFSGAHPGSQEMVSRIYVPFLPKKYLWNKQVWQ